MKRILFTCIACATSVIALAQTPKTYTSSEILLQLNKLKVLGSVLYVAAHPDDENTRLLTYLANEKLYRTGYLSLTRGDGGQNLIGDEQGVELGLIRTQELLAARRIDGAEQFFSRAYDFGFSKNPEETFQKWDHEKVLADVVWIVRQFQPDVIIARFPEDGRGGHGHHTASGILAREAFDAAADPNRFPEQLKMGVKVWQAKRMLWNTFNFGSVNAVDSTQFKLDVGGYNALLGKSYGELAAESRSMHKSQGFGVARGRGSQEEYFNTLKGDVPKKELTDGVDISWSRIGAAHIDKQLERITGNFNMMQPAALVKDLVALYKSMDALPNGYWKRQKMNELQNIIQQCSGLYFEATTSEAYGVQGDSLRINVQLNNRNGVNASLGSISINNVPGWDAYPATTGAWPVLDKNRNYNYQRSVFIAPNKKPSQPYWLANGMPAGLFNITDQSQIGMAENQPDLSAVALVKIDGVAFQFTIPVQYKKTDPVKGELYQPLFVVPPVEVKIAPEHLTTNASLDGELIYNVRSNRAAGKLTTSVTGSGTLASVNMDNLGKGGEKNGKWPLKTMQGLPDATTMKATAATGTETYNQYGTRIDYDHIPSLLYFKPATADFKKADIQIAGKKIGYINGAGDRVAAALQQIGYEVVILNEDNIIPGNLQQFDAIITGVRAYNVYGWLSNKYDILMDYVNNGGNLIVQYNTNSNIGPVKAKMSPFPFNIGRNRVTDENAVVNFVIADHPALNFPNKITAKDFEGWIQERSIYHAEGLDANFVTPISMADPKESASNGALAIAKYGKGNFVYTGLVFFRELPAGVPGAFRLMANLIAL